MRVLIIHNQLWAHYKAKIFSELYKIASAQPDVVLKVIHIAEVEKSRQNMGDSADDVHQYPYEVLFKGALEDVPLLPKVARLIESVHAFSPDVINVTGYFDPATWAIMLYCKLRDIPVIMSNESTPHDQVRHGLKERLKSWLVQQYDGFFCFGTKAAEYMLALGAKPEAILTKNAAIIDNEAIAKIYAENQPQAVERKKELDLPKYNFIFVGRLVEVKNLPFLLEAFQKIQAQTTDWGLILVGDGHLKASLQHQIEQQKIERVYFAGSHSWEKIPAWLTLGDVFVISSTSETWGLVVNEAMVCGMPVLVSTQCGCAVDLVEEGVNGFSFGLNNPAELVEKMQWYVQNPSSFASQGADSKRIIQKFSPETAANDMFMAFRKITLT